MSTTDVGTVDLKLEAVVIPVTNVDRALDFYAALGWRLDADFPFDNGVRVVQFTPPGSRNSVQFGTRITTATPGSAQGLYLIVSDIRAAREELAARGAEVSEVFHPGAPGAQFEAQAGERSAAPQPGTPATARSPRSTTRMATRGCCRRSPRACRAGSTAGSTRSDELRGRCGPGRGAAPGSGRPRGAREAHRRGGRELARLVRRLHGR